MNPCDYVYDIESYPNVFTCTIRHPATNALFVYEVSERRNDAVAFLAFIRAAREHNCRMVGFNNVGYDYPVIHHCINIGESFTAADAYAKTLQIIGSNDRFANIIWDDQMYVKQVDLFMIHHFDNRARMTSLKQIEFNMRSKNIGDLPVSPGEHLTSDQIDKLISYNIHDVDETVKFYLKSQDQIEFRDSIADMDATNFNDTKIGKEFFRLELEKNAPGSTGKHARTERPIIHLRDVILPYVDFTTPEFNSILDYMMRTSLTDTNKPKELKDLSCTFGGIKFVFGAGGIHGSVERQIVVPRGDEELVDIDVASFYPNLSIANRFYPQHLSERFCDIYKALYQQRKKHAKGSTANAMLKLALNGVYGDSNNVYSKGFYDPQYTMSITINGQLLLCMLAEELVESVGCKIVQINTDGMTLLVPKIRRAAFDHALKWWEDLTKLTLEQVTYGKMIIRDVNNYLVVAPDGTVKKRKGAYQYDDLAWHQDWSHLVVPRAAEAQMVHGIPVREFVWNHRDKFDFMGRAKGSLWADGVKQQKLTRYFVSTEGVMLYNHYSGDRRVAVHADSPVTICNDADDFDWSLVNYDWYIRQAGKLII